VKRALAVILQFAVAVHAETPVATLPDDARKTAVATSVRIEKTDGSLVGSGVLLTPDGYFLTKASEVPKMGALAYRLPDNTVAKAREVRRNARFDLVLGQLLNVKNLTPAKWSESKSLALGQWLLAPDQDGREARLGVMSARRREIKGGNAAIGIRMDEKNTADGVKIIGIAEDSPAAAAGLKANDVLVSIAGDAIKEYKAVHNLILNREPGEELEIQYRRGDKVSKCTVRLASRNRVLSNWTGEDYANGGISIRTDNFQEIVQHDIPLGPADMGGPLLNLLGQAVGINIARVDRVTTFALPMEIFWPSVRQWITEDRNPPKAEPAASVAKPVAKP
jgi:serine protease Do